MLTTLIYKSKTIFNIWPESGGPASVPPLKITLDSTERPVNVKLRRYSAAKREFLNFYMSQLVSLDIMKPNALASWEAVPHLVPKDSNEKYRTKIELRPVNAETKS